MTPREIDRRRALGLLGAGLGAAVVVGCGGSGDGKDASSGSDSTAGTTDATTGATSTPTSGAAAGAAGAAVTPEMFSGAASCTLTPSETEGPYYIDVDRIRSDIREDRQGTRLRLAARVLDSDGCTPVEDAVFEVWHCDAGGLCTRPPRTAAARTAIGGTPLTTSSTTAPSSPSPRTATATWASSPSASAADGPPRRSLSGPQTTFGG